MLQHKVFEDPLPFMTLFRIAEGWDGDRIIVRDDVYSNLYDLLNLPSEISYNTIGTLVEDLDEQLRQSDDYDPFIQKVSNFGFFSKDYYDGMLNKEAEALGMILARIKHGKISGDEARQIIWKKQTEFYDEKFGFRGYLEVGNYDSALRMIRHGHMIESDEAIRIISDNAIKNIGSGRYDDAIGDLSQLRPFSTLLAGDSPFSESQRVVDSVYDKIVKEINRGWLNDAQEALDKLPSIKRALEELDEGTDGNKIIDPIYDKIVEDLKRKSWYSAKGKIQKLKDAQELLAGVNIYAQRDDALDAIYDELDLSRFNNLKNGLEKLTEFNELLNGNEDSLAAYVAQKKQRDNEQRDNSLMEEAEDKLFGYGGLQENTYSTSNYEGAAQIIQLFPLVDGSNPELNLEFYQKIERRVYQVLISEFEEAVGSNFSSSSTDTIDIVDNFSRIIGPLQGFIHGTAQGEIQTVGRLSQLYQTYSEELGQTYYDRLGQLFEESGRWDSSKRESLRNITVAFIDNGVEAAGPLYEWMDANMRTDFSI